ncbi:MAG: 4Fe-4S dicluster domain-containing protein [Pseudomonadota bacterium]
MIKLTLYAAIIMFVAGLGIEFFRFKQNKAVLNPAGGHTTRLTFKTFFLNTFFQIRLLKAGKIRWAIHFGLFLSFLYLLIVHGLHEVTAPLFFSDYQPTLDPFQWLRNMAGGLVLIGSLAFLIRRTLHIRLNKDKKIKSKGVVTILMILLLIGSGFLLEATKIISEPIFMEMVQAYSDMDEEELVDLKVYWKDNYTVYFDENLQATAEQLENGQILNENFCLYCHSPIKSAIISHALAKTIYNSGHWFNSNRLDSILYGIHYGLCLILLVCFPFSRLFHILLIPFATSRQPLTAQNHQENCVSIHAATLYACTNCGYCSQVCSVYPNFQIQQNPDILPHTKIESVKALLNDPASIDQWRLNEGNQACTLCHKCTDICPSGIDLQSLWTLLDKRLGQMGAVNSNDLIDKTTLNEWISKEYIVNQGMRSGWASTAGDPMAGLTSNLADRTGSFENCIQCTVCSNVCPIVDYDSTLNDMTPHQIMNLLRLGKKHLATGTRMVWSCLTCYECQENCPQEIRVTDIILELRNAGKVKAEMIQRNQLTDKADR